MARRTSRPRAKSPRRAGPRALASVRERIDALDDRIVELLNRRAGLAQEAGRVKARAGTPAYVPEREREVLDRVAARSRGPLAEESLRIIYREVVSASRALEAPLVVSYLGPEATFTHEAAKRHFGLSARLLARRTVAEVFEDVEHDRAAHGVVPVESSQEGMVSKTLDLFVTSELSIDAEVLLDVHHHLSTRTGELRGVTKAYSHPQALAQCREWLERNLPGIPLVDVSSTACAAQLAAEDPSAAAVVSELAASLYHLQIAARQIEDARGNVTRFLVVGRDRPAPTGADRTSLVLALRDAPGILHRTLAPFARAGVSLSRIESRPSRRRAWDYLFFIDLEGHRDDPRVARAIDRSSRSCEFSKILGSYPRGRRAGRNRARTKE